MSNDAQKPDRWKKIRRGLSRQVKKTAELKKVLGGAASDGIFTYTPTSADRASAASSSSGSDTFTIAVSDGSGHVPLIIKPQD